MAFGPKSVLSSKERVHFRVLKALEEHPEYSQRELASALGLCLGRTNYVIRGLIQKGLLKVRKFGKSDRKLLKTAYVLTPAGLRHRLDITQSYIAYRRAEYEELRAELRALEGKHASR